jgi:hypothetical protein
VIPLIGLDLHDHHIAWLWRPVEFPESTLIPAILVKVVRIVVFPPGIIDPVIFQLDTVGLPK